MNRVIVTIVASAIIGSNAYATISCTHAEVKSNGEKVDVMVFNREGAPLKIADKLHLPDADKAYYYSHLEMSFSTKECTFSKKDSSVITCSSNQPNLHFTSPSTYIQGNLNQFKIVRNSVLEASGKKEVTYEWSILFIDLKNKIVVEHIPQMDCETDN